MWTNISVIGEKFEANDVFVQCEIMSELNAADACGDEIIPFVWTSHGVSTLINFNGRQFFFDSDGYWGEKEGREWFEVEDDEYSGIRECIDGDIQQVDDEDFRKVVDRVGGNRELWELVEKAQNSAMQAAMKEAIEFLNECRNEE